MDLYNVLIIHSSVWEFWDHLMDCLVKKKMSENYEKKIHFVHSFTESVRKGQLENE